MNKQSIITILFTVLMCMCGTKVFADKFEVGDWEDQMFEYSIINETEVCFVGIYSIWYDAGDPSHGKVYIPDYVQYNGNKYKVTSIGSRVFNNFEPLYSFTIPSSVTSIAVDAFSGCRPSYIKVNSENKKYDSRNNCNALIETATNTLIKGSFNTVIPYGVKSIMDGAFYNLSLKSITIPSSVISIGKNAFALCGPQIIKVESGNEYYDSRNNCNAIIEKSSNTLIAGCKNTIIPDGVLTIGDYAFSCCDLTSINIPQTVTTIGDNAFQYCSSLTSVSIPNSVTSIGCSAFSGCSGLTSVTIPNSVTSIGNHAFYGCGLTSITIPSTVTSIGNNAFYGCSSLTSVTIPNSVTSISESAFSGCSGLTSVTIPNSVTSIGNHAFYGCGLTSITIPNSVTSIGVSGFAGCSALTSVISEIENPFELANYVFNGVPTYAQLIVPKGKKAAYLSTTGWRKFTNIVEAGEVGQVFTVDGISYKIMENNTVTVTSGKNLSGDVSIPNQVSLCGETYSVNSISSEAFRNCDQIIAITIPNSVTSIGSNAFRDCSNLVSVIIGSGVISIGSRAFSNTNLKKTIWLTNTLPSGYITALGAINYVSNDQFNISNKVVYKFLSSYFEVDGIRYVPVSPSDHTCDAIDCVYNESASISKIAPTVTYKGVTLTVQKIQPYICYNNKFINHLTMEVSGAISNNAFNGCSNMQTAILGSTNNDIDKDKITGIYIGSNITSIGDWVFSECESLNKLNIADRESELTLGSNDNSSMFSSCPLESVYIGGNITYSTNSSKGYSPFYRNTAIRSVTITDKETEISQNEFYGCTNLQRVIIGDDVTTIGNRAFSSCSSLKYFAFGSQVANIGQNAFSDCTALIEITSQAITPPECGSQALDDINKWNCKLYVPDGCLDAYQNAEQWKEFFYIEEGEGTIFIDDGQGDANDDGKVDKYDIDAIVEYIMTGDLNSINFKNADVNKDGKVNVVDVTMLISIINMNNMSN